MRHVQSKTLLLYSHGYKPTIPGSSSRLSTEDYHISSAFRFDAGGLFLRLNAAVARLASFSHFRGREVKETDKNRYIWYNGWRFYVTQKDYSETIRPEWKEAKRRKVRIVREFSYEWLKERGYGIPADGRLVQEIIEDQQVLDALASAVASLSKKDRSWLNAIYCEDRTEREIAKDRGVSQNTVNYHKHRIIAKLQKFLKDYF
jgi:RNA polymerase sigma factor (sigma-70 family)